MALSGICAQVGLLAVSALVVIGQTAGASDVDTKHKRSVSLIQRQAWPGHLIPYTIDSSFSGNNSEMIMAAMLEWEKWTCVRFRPASQSDIGVIIRSSSIQNQCVTPVGYNGANSVVLLGQLCFNTLRSIIHELGHVIGLDHEHQHPDRTVVIHWENVNSDEQQFFDAFARGSVNTYGLPYDPLSIMHYFSTGFSKNGLPTMTHAIPAVNALMGRTDKLSSKSDIPAVRQMYQCPDAPLPLYGVECKDLDVNCAKVGQPICRSAADWAMSNCLVTCGMCSPGEWIAPDLNASLVTASKDTCQEEPSCARTAGVCTGSYADWARINCVCTCRGGSSTTQSSARDDISVSHATLPPRAQDDAHSCVASLTRSPSEKVQLLSQLICTLLFTWLMSKES